MGVVTASQESWIEPFSGLRPRVFAKLVRQLRREGADAPRPGRPWSLSLADRVLLVAAYWRTNLTMRAHNASHRQVRARVEHAFARMKTWKILRDCRLRGEGVATAMLGIARLHNLARTA